MPLDGRVGVLPLATLFTLFEAPSASRRRESSETGTNCPGVANGSASVLYIVYCFQVGQKLDIIQFSILCTRLI